MPRISWWVWLIGDSIGLACTIYFGWLCPQVIAVDSKVDRRVRRRIFWSWFFLFVYADVWLAILWPWGGEQLGTFLVTLIMFAYVMMGIWLGLRFLLWLGLGVTIVAFAGHFISSMMPGYQNLLLGLSGGTTMLMSGIYLTRRYRTANG